MFQHVSAAAPHNGKVRSDHERIKHVFHTEKLTKVEVTTGRYSTTAVPGTVRHVEPYDAVPP